MKLITIQNNSKKNIEDQLDLKIPINAMYSKYFDLPRYLNIMTPQYRYLVFTKEKQQFLKKSTEELFKILYQSLKYVLSSDQELSKFNINKNYWQFIKKSFKNVPIDDILYQRFDIGLSFKNNDMKLFELNTGVIGYLYYASYIQQRVHKVFSKEPIGVSSGQGIVELLEEKWKHICKKYLKRTKKVYFLTDDNDQEDQKLLALQFSEIINILGYETKICILGEGLQIGNDNLIYDKEDKCIVELIHSTFDWMTILKHLDQDKEEKQFLKILMNPNVTILEPIWIRLMGSKALLAVAWKLFPGHPLLLPTTFNPNNQPEFKQVNELVEKDVNGRASMQVRIISRGQNGLFKVKNGCIYQKQYLQHKINEKFYIVCPWMIGQRYAGFSAKETGQLISAWNCLLTASRIVDSI